MIPKFPNFKKLEISDKTEITAITDQFEPYSDFEFVSLWSYDTTGAVNLSKINGNLAMTFEDYVDGKIFLTFIGDNKVDETATELLSFAKKKNYINKLKLVPEETAKLISRERLLVEDDPDDDDYILDVEELVSLAGNKFGAKRNFVNRFCKLYEGKYKVVDLNLKEASVRNQINDLFLYWEIQAKRERKDTEREMNAIKKLLGSYGGLEEVIGLGIYFDNKLEAFSLNTILPNNFSSIEFEKANTRYVGIYQFLKQQAALQLQKRGCRWLNYEQDLGIPGLRKAKLSWNPVSMLRKYMISINE